MTGIYDKQGVLLDVFEAGTPEATIAEFLAFYQEFHSKNVYRSEIDD